MRLLENRDKKTNLLYKKKKKICAIKVMIAEQSRIIYIRVVIEAVHVSQSCRVLLL